MKNRIIRIFSLGTLFILAIFININVYADTCPSDVLSNLKEEASKVEYILDSRIIEAEGEGEENIKYAVYDIEFLNVSENIRIRWGYDGENFEFIDKETNKILDEPQGSKLYVEVLAVSPESCSSVTLRKFSFDLFEYNPNSTNEICKKYPNFTYCKEFVNTKEDLNDKIIFEEKLNKYKDSLRNTETVNGNEIISEDKKIVFFLLLFIPLTLVSLSIGFAIKRSKAKKQENYLG